MIGAGVVLGEVAQQRERARVRDSLLPAFTKAAGLNEEAARTLLAKFGLGADHVLRDAASLSPGERTRALIALLAARGVNCLVLDEPTNHLDVAAIEELERALDGFSGTVLLVTHDRRFLAGFRATRTLELSPRPGSIRSSRPSLTSRSTRPSSKSHRQLNHARAISRSGATTAARTRGDDELRRCRRRRADRDRPGRSGGARSCARVRRRAGARAGFG